LRTLGATSTEKSTVRGGQLNAVPTDAGLSGPGATQAATGEAKFCAIDNPECEACQ